MALGPVAGNRRGEAALGQSAAENMNDFSRSDPLIRLAQRCDLERSQGGPPSRIKILVQIVGLDHDSPVGMIGERGKPAESLADGLSVIT